MKHAILIVIIILSSLSTGFTQEKAKLGKLLSRKIETLKEQLALEKALRGASGAHYQVHRDIH